MMQLVHVTCARFADVGKGNEKICRDRGGQHHRRKASRTGGADGKKSQAISEINTTQARNFSPLMLLQMTPLVSVKEVAHEPNVSRTLHFVQREY